MCNMRKRDRFLQNLPFGKHRTSADSLQPPILHSSASSNLSVATSTPPLDPACGPELVDNLPLQLAIEKHYLSLPESERNAFQEASKNMSQETLLSEVKTFDNLHKGSSVFRPRTEIISKFLKLLQRFMVGISTAGQADPTPSAIIVGVAKIALISALEFTTFFDRLTDMIDRLNDYLDPLTEYAKGAHGSDLLLQKVAAVYGDLLEFWTAAHRIFVDSKGNPKKYISLRTFLRVQWEQFETAFGDIETRFRHHCEVLGHGSRALQLNAVKEAKEDRRGMYITVHVGQ